MAESHPLQNAWVLYAHEKDAPGQPEVVREICEFTTVEEFWKCWNVAPKPSELFFDGCSKKLLDGKSVCSLSIFKKGVTPSSVTSTSRKLSICKPMQIEVLDHFWENGVLSLIGEMIDETNNVPGCTISDRHNTAAPQAAPTLFSVDLVVASTADADTIGKIKERWISNISEGLARSCTKPSDKSVTLI